MKCLTLLLAASLLLLACGHSDYIPAENAFDAAREFIDATLKGDFDRASFYLVKDAQNEQELQKLKDLYVKKTGDQQEQYREASINILEEETIDEHTHIINYKNSYDNIARKVKTVNNDGTWLVDLKYTFNGNL